MSWRFPWKIAFWTILLPAPLPTPPPPPEKCKFYFYCRLAFSECSSDSGRLPGCNSDFRSILHSLACNSGFRACIRIISLQIRFWTMCMGSAVKGSWIHEKGNQDHFPPPTPKSAHFTFWSWVTESPYLRRVESTPHPNTFEKYRDTPPISMAYFCKSMPSSWHKMVYTPPICIAIRLPFVSWYFCRSIGVRGRWDTANYLFLLAKRLKVLQTAVGAVFAPTGFARISMRDLVADRNP